MTAKHKHNTGFQRKLPSAVLIVSVELNFSVLLIEPPFRSWKNVGEYIIISHQITHSHCNVFRYDVYPSQDPINLVSNIVSGYILDDRAIEGRSPSEARDFSSNLSVHTYSAAHSASSTVGTRGPFQGGKARPVCDADYSSPSSAEVVNE
jgi:hypothetical protein